MLCDGAFAGTQAKRSTWRSHPDKLQEIRDRVNQAGKLLTELSDAPEWATPWQHQAFDRISPLLKELADNTEAMINHLGNVSTSPLPGLCDGGLRSGQRTSGADYRLR
jgi:hypothetical protein